MTLRIFVSRDAGAVAVAASDQRLENLLGRKADLGGDGFSGQVFGIDFVFAKLVGNTQLVEKSHGIGLMRHESILSGNSVPVRSLIED